MRIYTLTNFREVGVPLHKVRDFDTRDWGLYPVSPVWLHVGLGNKSTLVKVTQRPQLFPNLSQCCQPWNIARKLGSYKAEVWKEYNIKTHIRNRGGNVRDSARQDPDVMLKWQLPKKLLHLSPSHTFLSSLLHTFFFFILDSHPIINTYLPHHLDIHFYWHSILDLFQMCTVAIQLCFMAFTSA